MKKIFLLAALFTISSFLISCKTLKEVPEDKTSAQIIQMAQNYVSIADYKSAELCYNTVIDRYGSDPAIYVEAKYELGRVYLAQKKYERAYRIFNELLDMYDRYGLMLPGAYKKLCNISLSQIPEVFIQEFQAKEKNEVQESEQILTQNESKPANQTAAKAEVEKESQTPAETESVEAEPDEDEVEQLDEEIEVQKENSETDENDESISD